MFSERIRGLRKSKKLTQEQLAALVGVERSTIGKWESTSIIPSSDMLIELSDFFNVSIDYLLGNTDNPANNKIHRIKVYGSVPAGIPLEAIENIIGWEEISMDLVRDGSEYIALKVKGDSMNPKYLDGDIVIVRLQPNCESGQDAIVFVNGYDATLKRIIKNENSVILQPLNPEYETKIYREGDEPITILGIVVELRRKI
jgi:repressor LexA